MKEKILTRIKEDKFYIIALVILITIFNIKLPYYVNAPGGTINIKDRIEYKEKNNYKGSLNMLYVTEYVASIPFYLLSYVIPDWDLESITESQVSDNESIEQINIRNKVMLENSINNAKYVAYKAANKKVEIENMKYIVVGVTEENNLQIGDEILQIENHSIENLESIRTEINKKNKNDQIHFKIKREGKEINVKSTIKEKEGKKELGVVILTNYSLKTDPQIKLKFKSSESGASGGLMMSLSIYSAISGEDILKGRNIAGTGTIDIDGNVGEIGGVKYKILGSKKADIFLCPKENYDEAMKVKKENELNMKIVSVESLKDAVNYLEGL